MLDFNALCIELTQLKQELQTAWLREMDSQSLQQALRDLDSAYGGTVKLRDGWFMHIELWYHRRMNTPTPPSYKRHRFGGESISQAVWLYFRFSLSYRDVEELMAARGIVLTS